MTFIIHHERLGGYIQKVDGMNVPHKDPRNATRFLTREEARNARPGHHRDMGGSGFTGRVVPYDQAVRGYDILRNRANQNWR